MRPRRRFLSPALMLCYIALAVIPAQAFYNPSSGRWLNRDPIGESGSYLLRSANDSPHMLITGASHRVTAKGKPQVISTADSELRERSEMAVESGEMSLQSATEQALYVFVDNSPVGHIDVLGLVNFSGCTTAQEKQLQADLTSFCNSAKTAQFKKCCNHVNIPQRLVAMCDNSDLTIECVQTSTSGDKCDNACGWSVPGGTTIRMCPLGLQPDPRCGPLGCTMLHEMTHMIGHGGEKWPNTVENCLLGCPQRTIK